MTAERPARGEELHAIEYIAALDARLLADESVLKARLQGIPNGWRDFRLALSVVNRLMGKVYETLPPKTLRYMYTLLRHGEVLVRVKPASRPPDFTIVEQSDLVTVLNAAMRAECAICMKEGKEIKQCALREAMDDICPPEGEHDAACCWYRKHAVSRPSGDYFGGALTCEKEIT